MTHMPLMQENQERSVYYLAKSTVEACFNIYFFIKFINIPRLYIYIYIYIYIYGPEVVLCRSLLLDAHTRIHFVHRVDANCNL
jgi:hypothetical protein